MAVSGSDRGVSVLPVTTPQQLAQFREVTRKYLEWLGEDLSFQQIESELFSLPGSYANEAGGCMLLASAAADGGGSGQGSEAVIGAVALRRLAGHTSTVQPGQLVGGVPLERVCEMKRLFVLAEHHGLGAGAALVRALLAEAAARGYSLMVLDTLERLEGANRLYCRLGFEPCERYNDCPLPGVLYFARRLDAAPAPSGSISGSEDAEAAAAAADR
ncbi:acetyltransferase [Chlorella sorokiniana]|uniref:Acetyltransferase n=1 Tax=Chlorella sorokiniana TaxID=3076 RepID=A0A2P6TLC3_CHLSO|nr:acetyltransferase [Chlorella sorokiniana]|eukprot:PRW45046.1 acetyltransferase [Chlorella sorokiniana]